MCLNARWPMDGNCYYNIRHYEKDGRTRWMRLWDCENIRNMPLDCAPLSDGRVVVIGQTTSKNHTVKLYSPSGQVIWKYDVLDFVRNTIGAQSPESWLLRFVATRSDDRLVILFERSFYYDILAVEIEPDPRPVVTRWTIFGLVFYTPNIPQHLDDPVSLRDGTVAIPFNKNNFSKVFVWLPDEDEVRELNINWPVSLRWTSNDIAFDPSVPCAFFIRQSSALPVQNGTGLIRFPYPRFAGDASPPDWERNWPPFWRVTSWDVTEDGRLVVSGEIDNGSDYPFPTLAACSVDTGDLLYTFNTRRPKDLIRICHDAGDADVFTRGVGLWNGPERWTIDGNLLWRHKHTMALNTQYAVHRLDGSVTVCMTGICSTRQEASFVGPED